MLQQLKPQVDSLVQMAEQASDPVGTADLIFEQVFMNLGDDDYEKLANFVDNDKFLTYVGIINPEARKYPEWFAAFKGQTVKLIAIAEADALQAPTQLAPGQ